VEFLECLDGPVLLARHRRPVVGSFSLKAAL
jgi:hypothetical protein